MTTQVHDERAAAHGTAYADPAPPLREYAALIAALNGGFAVATVLAARAGRLPERPSAGDIALFGVASHKLSRLVTRDRVTGVVRAPFARSEGDAGPGEVDDVPRGTGARRAVGELLTCPYCLDVWTTAGLWLASLAAPRTTRFAAGALASVTVSDTLQLAYRALQRHT